MNCTQWQNSEPNQQTPTLLAVSVAEAGRPRREGTLRAGKPGFSGAAGTSAVGGRPVGGGGGRPAGRPAGGGHHAKRWTRCGFSLRFQFQSGRRENARISRQFQFKTFGTLPNLCLPENKRGEAESYTKVHFSELKYISQNN